MAKKKSKVEKERLEFQLRKLEFDFQVVSNETSYGMGVLVASIFFLATIYWALPEHIAQIKLLFDLSLKMWIAILVILVGPLTLFYLKHRENEIKMRREGIESLYHKIEKCY